MGMVVGGEPGSRTPVMTWLPMPKSALPTSKLSSKIESRSNLAKCEHFPTTSGKA
jgi:hypothetical protein